MSGRRFAAASLSAVSACAFLSAAAPAAPADEAAASALFDRLSGSPPALRLFLKAMPKGGDLHNHLSGTPYAEDYLAWAAEAKLCVDAAGSAITPPPCPPERRIRHLAERDPFAHGRLVDALSTRGLRQGVGRDAISGHDQFFGSFGRFGAIAGGETARSIAAARRLAAGDRVSYVEIIQDPEALTAHVLAGPDTPLDDAGLPAAFDREVADAPSLIARARTELDAHEAKVRTLLSCDGQAAQPACAVTVRYLAWGWRGLPPAQAFRSLVLAFALADSDPRFVGINLVMPEDSPIALRDYRLHMAMIRFLSNRYPHVHRSLHAGELAGGQVPPADIADHIARALDAGAQRIGHGTAIAHEDDALATLRRMARENIPVEVNLTSNAVILNVAGGDHPLALYRRLGVPVVLSTDDEGILRTDMTSEYARAARDQGLRYADLKGIARASLEHAFLPGASLWRDRAVGTPAASCARTLADPACQALARDSEKARAQIALEQDFDRFEREEVPALAMALR